jgi:hypothetical protein
MQFIPVTVSESSHLKEEKFKKKSRIVIAGL